MNEIVEYVVMRSGATVLTLLGLLFIVRIGVRLSKRDIDIDSMALLIVIMFVYGLINIVGKYIK